MEPEFKIAKLDYRSSEVIYFYKCTKCHNTNITGFHANAKGIVYCPDCGTIHILEEKNGV